MSGERDQCRRRLPFCAEPERLSASRPRLFGVAEFRSGAADRRQLSAAHRGYRPDPLQAGIRDRDLSRISTGSASRGRSRCGGNPGILPIYRDASKSCRPEGWFIRVSKAAPRSQDWSSSARRAAVAARPGRRAALSRCREVSFPPTQRARLLAIGCTLRAAARHGGGVRDRGRSGLDRTRRGSGRRDRHGRRPAARPGATLFWPAGRRRPVTTSRWRSTTPCKA